MLHELPHIVLHTLKDNVILILFLFLTYVVMEYLEHMTGDKTQKIVKKAGKVASGRKKRILSP